MFSSNEEEVQVCNLIAVYNYLKESYRDDGAKFFPDDAARDNSH